MCGIVGVYGFVNDDVLEGMLDAIYERGPDDKGVFHDDSVPLMMGARRLSIVDLAGGSQPIYNENDSVVVVFNGEIYNHKQLREDLSERGHSFSSNCDTEVLVHLWEEYGTAMPEHLNGMFTFSIWDRDQEKLFLARDRLGIKPLYYRFSDGEFMWGSELPAILETGIDVQVDPEALNEYFRSGYAPWPRTIVNGIRKLRPGSSIVVSNDDISINKYWSLDVNPISGSPSHVASRLRDQLEESVQERMMADVPVGAFLSGGLDSSAIVGLMSEKANNVKTYSVGFNNPKYDESDEARFVANHFETDHHELTVDLSSMGFFEDVVKAFGEPLSDPAILPTYLLSKRAREDVKVVLTGEGADELFAGYDTWNRVAKHRRYLGGFPDQVYDTAAWAANRAPIGEPYLNYFGSLCSNDAAIRKVKSGIRTATESQEVLENGEAAEDNHIKRTLADAGIDSSAAPSQAISAYLLRSNLCDGLLYKVDHATMAHSLEARVPFLHHELVEYAYNIPWKYKINGKYKPLLRRAVADIVPDQVMHRNKQNFALPVADWFRSDHPDIVKWLDSGVVNRTPYLDPDTVKRVKLEHRSGQANHSILLWRLVTYIVWYDIYIGNQAATN